MYEIESIQIDSGQRIICQLSGLKTKNNPSANEKFGIINLNVKNEINGIQVLSEGSLDTTIVHPREVFKASFLNNAAAIILFHNHPSGNPFPSQDDLKITSRLIECGELLGIQVIDHIIIGENGFVSLKELGMMKKESMVS